METPAYGPVSLPPAEPDSRPEVVSLLVNLREALPGLRTLLASASDHWGYEDPVYRFYHQSFKVYTLQDQTLRIVRALRSLAPDRELNSWFREIVNAGTGLRFEPEHNTRWLATTRPIVEAFFHARYFLEMAVRYGDSLDQAPRTLPSGWAALLCLYDLR